jgi:biopolymer transport protein ExbD
MRFPRTNKIFRGQLEAAPFAGVFFLLVIFLLLSSSLVFIPGVPIRLPEAVNLPGTANPTLVVALDAAGQIYFENQITPENQLKVKLRVAAETSREPLTLVVQADKLVPYETLQRLLLLAGDAGIKEMLMATRPPVAPAAAPPKT